jgi:hypothetical protein
MSLISTFFSRIFCYQQIQNKILGCSSKNFTDNQHPTESWSSSCLPTTIILGFSKGGVVVNQLVTELSCWASESTSNSVDVPGPNPSHLTHNILVPPSATDVLSSISEYHYVDVGLNCSGAYITDRETIKEIANYMLRTNNNLCFVLHGTPRQWSDPNRLWIQKEKDTMLQLLRDEVQRCEGRLVPYEKIYFDGRPRSLRMHFEILEAMDMS